MSGVLPAKATDERRWSAAAIGSTVSAEVEIHLDRIALHDHRLSAFIRVMSDEARLQADVLDHLEPAARGPLHGMIVSLKDIIDVAGVPTTCGSHTRLDRTATKDAVLVARLREAGAVFIGKANCHEFAFGGPAFDLPFPPARNPWDSELFPGGSSSGSGVSVAAGFCHASIGSDTAGSIRLPSSHCGVVGLKISTGGVPLDGVYPLSPTLDSVGPMARSVADCASLFAVMTGRAAVPSRPGGGSSIGIPDSAWLEKLECNADVVAAYERAQELFVEAGIELHRVSLPPLAAIHAASGVVMMREVAELYSKEVQSDFLRFGEMFRDRALLGAGISDRHYRLALAQCKRFAEEIAAAAQGVAAIMLPAYPVGPAPLSTVDKFYFLKRPNLNAIANCAGMPTLSLPVLRDDARRPLGIQLMAARGEEPELLAIGERLEAFLGYPHEIPFAEGPNGRKKGE